MSLTQWRNYWYTASAPLGKLRLAPSVGQQWFNFARFMEVEKQCCRFSPPQ